MSQEMKQIPFPIENRYNRYNLYLRKLFGERVQRVSLDMGFTCPTRDGTLGYGGCLYCNNESFAPKRDGKIFSVSEQLSDGIKHLRRYRGINKYIAYFQAYTNTYAEISLLEKLYTEALSFPGVVGIAIGTRPDCINDEILTLLSDLNRDSYVSIEFGIESVHDKTLKWAKRGHDFKKTEWAVKEAKRFGLHVAGHYILGFPTESEDEMVRSAKTLNQLNLDALKIHHLHVVKDTPLADLYIENPFKVFPETEWINLVCNFLELLDPRIVIQRLCGEAKQDTLIAPVWKSGKSEVLQGIKREFERRDTWQGYRFG